MGDDPGKKTRAPDGTRRTRASGRQPSDRVRWRALRQLERRIGTTWKADAQFIQDNIRREGLPLAADLSRFYRKRQSRVELLQDCCAKVSHVCDQHAPDTDVNRQQDRERHDTRPKYATESIEMRIFQDAILRSHL